MVRAIRGMYEQHNRDGGSNIERVPSFLKNVFFGPNETMERPHRVHDKSAHGTTPPPAPWGRKKSRDAPSGDPGHTAQHMRPDTCPGCPRDIFLDTHASRACVHIHISDYRLGGRSLATPNHAQSPSLARSKPAPHDDWRTGSRRCRLCKHNAPS